MGYYQRRAGEEAAKMIGAVLLLSLVAVGPYIVGKNIGGKTVGWIFEGVYIVGIVLWLIIAYSREQERARQRAAAEAEYNRWVAHMMWTGAPFFDQRASHFRHGTCTIRHRSVGAAGRCHSEI